MRWSSVNFHWKWNDFENSYTSSKHLFVSQITFLQAMRWPSVADISRRFRLYDGFLVTFFTVRANITHIRKYQTIDLKLSIWQTLLYSKVRGWGIVIKMCSTVLESYRTFNLQIIGIGRYFLTVCEYILPTDRPRRNQFLQFIYIQPCGSVSS